MTNYDANAQSPARRNASRVKTPQSLNAYVKSICDIMRRGGAASALQYVPELTWMLFLRILDDREEQELEQANAVGCTGYFNDPQLL